MKALVEMESTGLLTLLRNDKYAHLSRMYSLFRRVEGGLALVRGMMSDIIKENGRQLVTDPEKCKVRGPRVFELWWWVTGKGGC